MDGSPRPSLDHQPENLWPRVRVEHEPVACDINQEEKSEARTDSTRAQGERPVSQTSRWTTGPIGTLLATARTGLSNRGVIAAFVPCATPAMGSQPIVPLGRHRNCRLSFESMEITRMGERIKVAKTADLPMSPCQATKCT